MTFQDITIIWLMSMLVVVACGNIGSIYKSAPLKLSKCPCPKGPNVPASSFYCGKEIHHITGKIDPNCSPETVYQCNIGGGIYGLLHYDCAKFKGLDYCGTDSVYCRSQEECRLRLGQRTCASPKMPLFYTINKKHGLIWYINFTKCSDCSDEFKQQFNQTV